MKTFELTVPLTSYGIENTTTAQMISQMEAGRVLLGEQYERLEGQERGAAVASLSFALALLINRVAGPDAKLAASLCATVFDGIAHSLEIFREEQR